MIELLGVGVPRGDEWLLHRVCCRLLRAEVALVCSAEPAERGAFLEAVSGRAIPEEGRVWVSGVPLVSGRVARVRRLVASLDLTSPIIERRSVLWNCLARHPRLGGFGGLLRFPRESERRAALRALARVGLEGRSREPVSVLDALDRARLRMARSLWSDPEFLVVSEPEAAFPLEDAATCLDILRRLSREQRVGVVVSGRAIPTIVQRADRALELSEGLLVFDGVPGDLLRRLDARSREGARPGTWQPR